MEGGGERPAGSCPPPPHFHAALSSSPPLPLPPQVEPALEAPPPPLLPTPMNGAAAEAAATSPDGGRSVESPAHLPYPGEEQREDPGTPDYGGPEEEPVAVLPFLLDEEEAKEATSEARDGDGSQADPSAPVLTDDLREKIVRQVEYYFSDENLPTDKFLLKYVRKNKEGFVPVAVIASFRRMRKLVQDNALIVAALRTSSQLAVSLDGKKVKRLYPLPATEMEDTKPCIVLVENLPEDCSRDNIQKVFGSIGNIRSISICDPHRKGGTGVNNKEEMMISSKVHALVEYETTEAAGNAVATLNDEKNWRSGMRVELLLKRMEKFGIIPRGCKSTSEKNSDVYASEAASDEQNVELQGHHDEMGVQEESKHISVGKTGQKVQKKGRGKGSQHHVGNGHGHGHVPTGSITEGSCKPPPGPRMPDGTRGFTMGRGKSLTLPSNGS